MKLFHISMMLMALAMTARAATLRSGNAMIREDGAQWVLGTDTIEKTVALEGGKFLLKSFRHKAANQELIPAGAPSEEFSFALGYSPDRIGGASGGWKLVSAKTAKLKQCELQLDITLEREILRVTKTYVVHPQSSVIREWLEIKNTGSAPQRVVEPDFLNFAARLAEPKDLDFYWMSGGDNKPNSWRLQKDRLSSGKSRVFDSFDPFPNERKPGEGVNAKILLNDKQVWPAEGWRYVHDAQDMAPFDVNLEVKAGDRVAFILNMNKNSVDDTTFLDPSIAYGDGVTHKASSEFSDAQDRNGWSYQYLAGGQFTKIGYDKLTCQWQLDGPTTSSLLVNKYYLCPAEGKDAARVWTAPTAGKIHVTGNVYNIGCLTADSAGTGPGPGYRAGSCSYAPWFAFMNGKSRDGLFIGWDTFARWGSVFTQSPDGAVSAQLKLAGYVKALAPGETITTPKAFVGLFRGDLDDAGNELLDWQYRYMWDYTREGWFPAIRMLGYWGRGTGSAGPGESMTRCNPDCPSLLRKVFGLTDLMRYVGADVYHRDFGWWKLAGDWEGPDWRISHDYLAKYTMGQLIYAYMNVVDPTSKVGREHPDWIIGQSCVDASRPEVVAYLLNQLDSMVKRWGDFEWRNDNPMTPPPLPGTEDLMVGIHGQDQGMRSLIKGFLDHNPGCGFQACNGGGFYAGYDYIRYASCIQISDGGVGMAGNYDLSLLFPPDKTCHMPDFWRPDNYDKVTWRGLLCHNFDMSGDTFNAEKMDGLRELIDIYHYLLKQGVVGRWVKVYRPVITGDDPTMYFERLSGDRKRGLIITKHPAPRPLTIKPKGLLPGEKYQVSYQESEETSERTGADLMENGLSFESLAPGELIYLNLPYHPGNRLDKKPPQAPKKIKKQWGENMGYPGVEVAWEPAKDDQWVSYYEVVRGSTVIDKVAKGTFYFDHSAGADLAAKYQIRAVDGAGNRSKESMARGAEAKAAKIFDDAPEGGIVFTGPWGRETGLHPAYQGTIAQCSQKGATAEVSFEGKKVLIFSKLGWSCGKASVSIDGGPGEVIDTYSADEIWGACVYRKELSTAGRHTLRLTVLGEGGPLAKGGVAVYLDGVRAEP